MGWEMGSSETPLTGKGPTWLSTCPFSPHLQGVTLIGSDERAGAGVPWLQGKPLLPIGVHHTLHIFS